MSTLARTINFEREHSVDELGVLEDRLDHVARDVADLKLDVRRLDAKVDALGGELTAHRVETVQALGNLRAEMREGFGELRAETQKDLGELRAEMQKNSGELRADLEKGLGKRESSENALRADTEKGFGQLRADLEKGFGQLRAEMKELKVWLLSWAIATLIAALTLSFNVAKFISTPAPTAPANAMLPATR